MLHVGLYTGHRAYLKKEEKKRKQNKTKEKKRKETVQLLSKADAPMSTPAAVVWEFQELPSSTTPDMGSLADSDVLLDVSLRGLHSQFPVTDGVKHLSCDYLPSADLLWWEIHSSLLLIF